MLGRSPNTKKYITDEFPRYHHDVIMGMHAEHNLTGKKILDVGGSNIPAELMRDLGVKQFICLDTVSKWFSFHNSATPSLYFGKKISPVADVSDYIDSEFCFIVDSEIETAPLIFNGYFDVVISISTFEHVTDLTKTLEIIYGILSPSGFCHTQYEPIFTSPVGHHCYLSSAINFVDTRELDNLHLLYTKEEARRHLTQNTDWGQDTVDRVVFAIYDSDIINRKTFNEHILAIMNSKFNRFNIHYFNRMPAGANVEFTAAAKFGSMRFDVRGIQAQLFK